MENSQIQIHAFGKIYPLSLDLIKQSTMLSLALHESHVENNTIDLNLDPIYQIAFEYIYNRLLGNSYPLDYSILPNVMILADYLGVDIIANELVSVLLDLQLQGYVFDKRIQDILKNKLWDATNILSQNSIYENLPNWVQQLFNYYQITSLPITNTSPILIRFLPQQQYQFNPAHTIFPPGYSRRCQRPFQPNILPIESIPQIIQAGQQVTKYTDQNGTTYYMTCRNPAYPYIRMKGKNVCCGARVQDLEDTPLENLDDDFEKLLSQKKGVAAEGDFTVFVNSEYDGNYIYAVSYTIIPELNAIII